MHRYLETFFRNRWLISLPAILLVLSGSGLVYFVRKEYVAGATLWAESALYLDVPKSGGNTFSTPAQVHSGRFKELMATDSFARAVVRATPVGTGVTRQHENLLVYDVHNAMAIWPAGTYIVQVRFSHLDPGFALAVVQEAIEGYQRVMAESANQQAAEAIAFYQERVKTYEETVLPRSGQAVSEYLRAHPESSQQPGQTEPTDPNLALLLQQAELDRMQYERYQQRLDEVLTQSQAASKHREFAFRVVDEAAVTNAGTPTVGKKKLLMFAGAGVGVSVGCIALFLLVATELDRTMRNAGDIRHWLRLPVLEVVPDYSPESRGRFRRRTKGRRDSSVSSTAHPTPSV